MEDLAILPIDWGTFGGHFHWKGLFLVKSFEKRASCCELPAVQFREPTKGCADDAGGEKARLCCACRKPMVNKSPDSAGA